MAWNPSPEVAALRDYSKTFGDDYLILVHINTATNKLGFVSYGATKAKCKRAAELAEVARRAVENEIIAEGLE